MSWELGISAEVVAQTAPRVCGPCAAPSLLHRQGGEEEEEEGIFKAKTMNEVGAGRDLFAQRRHRLYMEEGESQENTTYWHLPWRATQLENRVMTKSRLVAWGLHGDFKLLSLKNLRWLFCRLGKLDCLKNNTKA